MYTILAFGIILSKLQRLQTVNFSVGKFKIVSWEKVGVLPPNRYAFATARMRVTS